MGGARTGVGEGEGEGVAGRHLGCAPRYAGALRMEEAVFADLQQFIAEAEWVPRVIASILLVIAFVIGRQLAVRAVRGTADVIDPVRRRQAFYVRSVFNTLLAFGLLTLWLGQVQNIVLSLTAVLVALVIATKELLMCVSGFALRAGASMFSVGSWIEVNGVRGEVVDYNLLSTTLLELSPPSRGHGYTGSIIVLPNSVFLSQRVRSEKLPRHFVQHGFTIFVEPGIDAIAAQQWLEKHARDEIKDFAGLADVVGRAADRRLSVNVQGPAPSVGVATSDTAKIAFVVRLFCPAARGLELERDLTAALLTAIAEGRFVPAAGTAGAA